MHGKQKCRILKEIRQKIADENDIKYVTQECTHKGECSGTCPRCESELRYLEQQLKQRASLGKRIKLAARFIQKQDIAALRQIDLREYQKVS